MFVSLNTYIECVGEFSNFLINGLNISQDHTIFHMETGFMVWKSFIFFNKVVKEIPLLGVFGMYICIYTFKLVKHGPTRDTFCFFALTFERNNIVEG